MSEMFAANLALVDLLFEFRLLIIVLVERNVERVCNPSRFMRNAFSTAAPLTSVLLACRLRTSIRLFGRVFVLGFLFAGELVWLAHQAPSTRGLRATVFEIHLHHAGYKRDKKIEDERCNRAPHRSEKCPQEYS